MAVVGNLSTYLQEALLNHVLRNTAYSSPTTVYCGIVSDVATDENMEAGTLTDEITGYTGNRKAITFSAPSEVDTKATSKNSAVLEFELMPAPAGREAKYAIVCDAATAGHILYWCPLVSGGVPTTKVWNTGDTFRVPADGLVCALQ